VKISYYNRCVNEEDGIAKIIKYGLLKIMWRAFASVVDFPMEYEVTTGENRFSMMEDIPTTVAGNISKFFH